MGAISFNVLTEETLVSDRAVFQIIIKPIMATTNIFSIKMVFVVIVSPNLWMDKSAVKTMNTVVDGVMESIHLHGIIYVGARRHMSTHNSKRVLLDGTITAEYPVNISVDVLVPETGTVNLMESTLTVVVDFVME